MARNIGILASKEELEEMYWGKRMSLYKIAPCFNTTPQTVWGWLKHYRIASRPAGGYHWKGRVMTGEEIEKCIAPLRGRHLRSVPSREELIAKYVDQHMSLRDIAESYQASTTVVVRWFKECGLDIRSLRESHLNYRPEKIQNILRGCARRPTKPESQLSDLLNEWLPGEWLYNGTGEHLILGGKIPDFVNINGCKAVIELYGDYWHKGENPEDRVAIFDRYGFALLVIWEHELENPEALKERIISFGNSLGKEKKLALPTLADVFRA